MNKVAIVTGGNQGVGFASAQLLAKHGFQVIIGCRDIRRGNDSVARLKDMGFDVSCGLLDVSLESSVEAFVGSVIEKYTNIHVLINNAAIYVEGKASFMDIRDEVYIDSFVTNVCGPLRMCKAIVPKMKEVGYGRIVNVSSGMGLMSEMIKGGAAYGISKAGLNALTKVIAIDLLGENGDIKVNAVCPGWVKTRMGGVDAPRKPWEAAEDVVWAAMIDENGPTGEFLRNKHAIPW
jgi:NAD(P)-dependent dehydrogenase (short-subunit alcohol dehydrogenase family)